MIRVAITDDHPMVAEGIESALRDTPEISVIASYSTGKELLRGLKRGLPDVLLLDIQLPDKSGMELAKELMTEYPDLYIIILTGIDSAPILVELMRAGCRGYLLKTMANRKNLITAISQVYEGNIYLDNRDKDLLLKGILETKQRPLNGIGKKLTAREKDVLGLIAGELTNQEIAERLFISARTVENHRHNLLQKLEVKNAVGLVKAAIQLGLMHDK